jgi:hypothetical protein
MVTTQIYSIFPLDKKRYRGIFHENFICHPFKSIFPIRMNQLGENNKKLGQTIFPTPTKLKGGESDSRFKNLKKGR